MSKVPSTRSNQGSLPPHPWSGLDCCRRSRRF